MTPGIAGEGTAESRRAPPAGAGHEAPPRRTGEGPPPLAGFREVGAGAAAMREAARRREGWTRRFVAAPPRLEEATALYEALGHEVRLDPPGPKDLPADCGDCPVASALFRVVYTRRPGSGRPRSE